MLSDIQDELMKHQLPYRSALVLQTSSFDPKCLTIGILASVLIAMDYFFGCQKSTFNLENKQIHMSRNFFLFTTELDLLTLEFFSSYVYLCIFLKGIGKIQLVSELTILLNL